MNFIAETIKSLLHSGVSKRDGAPIGSGRYPLGSGENPYQHGSVDFLSRVNALKKQGLSEKQIAESMGLTTTQLRVQRSLAKDEQRMIQVAEAKRLRAEGYSLNEIAEKMGFANDSSVRSLLNEGSEERMNQAKVTADYIKKMVDEKGMVDVGAGVERELGVSREKLNEALYILELEGYPVYGGRIPQVTNPAQQTTLKVICPPGTEHKEIYDYGNIHSVKEYDYILTDDGSKIRKAFEYPASMDSSRLKIRYAEDGGIEKDGVIEIRRGVKDLSLGESHYAQVRILVDGDKYLKGMAVYSDDLPDGTDIIFNTNKKRGTPTEKVLKPISSDPDNPFGALLKERGGQSTYIGDDGKEHLSLINKTREEGDWGEWSHDLPSQFLSKQKTQLIKKQLGLAIADKKEEYDEIISLTNPTVKKVLLKSFADDCDSTAVHLKAAALPRQQYQVILPLTSAKDNEVYAPNYKNGEQIALIRYPHGGTFEIPILTVNNKNAEGKKVIGNSAKDAIGINSKVAARLSGADFDGDTVMVIPISSKVKITSTAPLEGLKDFDPKLEYPYIDGMKVMRNTQNEMGKISNLITDMTLRGATEKELAAAVRHSMVVIDAEKHKLNYKQSEKDNNIAELKRKYQGAVDENGKYHEGAATIISRAKSEVSVEKRKGSPKINIEGSKDYDPNRPEGVYLWSTANDSNYIDKKTGKTVTRTQRSTKMAETDDAFSLVSDANTPQERLYAEYANQMKALANRARKEMVTTGKIEYKASAKEVYSEEVSSLNAKLNIALKNAPRERQAQVIANSVVSAKKQGYEDAGLTKEEIKKELKKERQRALVAARAQVGAERHSIEITDKEWEAIQSGAISENKLYQILDNTDVDKLRERATPRQTTSLSQAKINKISSMSASGYSTSEIAEALGVSTSTVSKYLND